MSSSITARRTALRSTLPAWRIPLLALGAALLTPHLVAATPATVPATARSTAPASNEGPDSREIPLPTITTAFAPLSGVSDLPLHPEMPDVLTRADGTPVRTPEQWRARRAEIRRILEHYAVGHSPPPPGNITARELRSESLAENSVRYRLVRLTFGPQNQLSLDRGIFTPATGRLFPAVIIPAGTPPGATPLPRLPPGPGQGRGGNPLLSVGSGPTPGTSPDAALAAATNTVAPLRATDDPRAAAEAIARRMHQVFARGYAYVMFNHNDCGEDTTLRQPDGSWAFRATRFPAAYPGYDWGLLGVWAWGVSRIVDYLETDPAIDRTKLIVTGVSRTGKSALVAGAFDERIALTAPVVTGGGGVGAYRFSGFGRGGKEGLGDMMRKYPNWFSPHLRQFWGHTDRLPFDQHWFIALIAPRPFIALEGLSDSVSLLNAVQQSIAHVRPAYALLGAADRLGVSYGDHGHAFAPEAWTALLDFADVHLRDRTANRRFDAFPTEEQVAAATSPATSSTVSRPAARPSQTPTPP